MLFMSNKVVIFEATHYFLGHFKVVNYQEPLHITRFLAVLDWSLWKSNAY